MTMDTGVVNAVRFTVADARLCACGMTVFSVVDTDGTADRLHYGLLPTGLNAAELTLLRTTHEKLAS